MEPLREITLLAALHDITFSAHGIPTSDNYLADLLSRRQFAKIADLCPLLAQNLQPTQRQTSSVTPLRTGMPMLASLALPLATSGGASVPTHDAPTQLLATATEPSPPSPASTHLSL
jgi:hypothetical protein